MVAVTFPGLEVVQFLDTGSEARRAATLLCGVQSVLSNVRWKSAAERVAEYGIPSLVIVNAGADGLFTPKGKPPASATSAEALALCLCLQTGLFFLWSGDESNFEQKGWNVCPWQPRAGP